MTIDKQALREAAEKVNSGNWSYEEFSKLGLPGGAHIKIDGRDAIYCLNKPTGGIEQSRAVLAYIAAFNPKVALALLDKLETAENYIAELEARVIVLPQRLSPEGYYIDEAYMVDDTEGEYLDRDAVIDAIRAAGIKVKG
ncbi:ead/Ea22-like family protein [Salmonella enterica]|nr:ead/Ea22-like family protein [Salmonella enterica]